MSARVNLIGGPRRHGLTWSLKMREAVRGFCRGLPLLRFVVILSSSTAYFSRLFCGFSQRVPVGGQLRRFASLRQ